MKKKPNYELMEQYKQPLPGLVRPSKNEMTRMVKRVLKGGMPRRRRSGKPRIKRLQDIEKDLRKIGINEWRKATIDEMEKN